jgi:uncharacterized protein (UPF0303 family)
VNIKRKSDRRIARELEDCGESEAIILDSLVKYGSAKNADDAFLKYQKIIAARISEAGYRRAAQCKKQQQEQDLKNGIDIKSMKFLFKM